MANDESVIREVEQELAEDRQWEFFQKYGPMVIGGAAIIVVLVGARQFLQHQKTVAADKGAIAFHEAVEQLETEPEAGRLALEQFKSEAPAGYSILADMRLAASYAAGGERLGALEIYRRIYRDGAASRRLAQLARLRAAVLSLDDGHEAVAQDLGELEGDTSAIGFYAREISAVAAFNAGDYLTSKNMFDRAIENPQTPGPVRLRAEEFSALAASGQAGVNVETRLQVQDLSDVLDRNSDDSATTDLNLDDLILGDGHSHDDGHDHGHEGHFVDGPEAGGHDEDGHDEGEPHDDDHEGEAHEDAGLLDEAAETITDAVTEIATETASSIAPATASGIDGAINAASDAASDAAAQINDGNQSPGGEEPEPEPNEQ